MAALQFRIGVTDAKLGAALGVLALATLVGQRATPPLLSRYRGQGIVAAVTGLALAMAVLAGASDYRLMLGGLVMLGLSFGILDVGLNVAALTVERASGRALVGLLGGVWNLSVVVGSLAVALLTLVGLGIAVRLAATSAVLVAVAVALTWAPTVTIATAAESTSGRPTPGRRMALLILAGFTAFFAEAAASDWSSVYLVRVAKGSATVAATGFAAFSLATALTLFTLDRLFGQVSRVAMVRIGALVAAGSLVVAVVVPAIPIVVAGYALFGAGLAPAMPAVLRAASASARGAGAVSAIVSMSYLGAMAGPAVIGFTAAAIGLRTGLLLAALAAAVVAHLAARLG